MVLMEVTYHRLPNSAVDDDQVSHALNHLFGVWRMNGQVMGREASIVRAHLTYQTPLLCPEVIALDDRWANKYTSAAKAGVTALGLVADEPHLMGEDIDGSAPCTCASPPSYIVSTNYLTLESPVWCGDCFRPIPLYHLPKTYDDEYYNIIVWQSKYQACDTLFMNSSVLERATNRELARFQSALSQQGYQVCRQIEQRTMIPTYYTIRTHYGRNLTQERQRRCPSCGAPWLLDTTWHRFDFKCDPCRLVGNIAYSM
jgi:predicted  nucleic acid-binding Zn ribbon protein